MADRTYYVICSDNCKFEGMTREQIVAAIVEATGNTPQDVDAAFITKIKEQNTNAAVKVWVGSQAEYNALTEKDPNTLYYYEDTDYADLVAAIENIINGTTPVEEAANAANADDAKKVNGLEIKTDASGVLKNGDMIITQKRLVWDGSSILSENEATENTVTTNEDLRGKRLEIEVNAPFKLLKGYGKMNSAGYTTKNCVCSFIDVRDSQINYCEVYAKATETSLVFSMKVTTIAGDNIGLSGSVSVKKVYEVIE